jgi:hypothetical protein
MTQVACLKVHMKLEKRLTRVELLSGGQIIATIGLIVTIAYFLMNLWRLGHAG